MQNVRHLIRHLYYFMVVAEQENFHRAAAKIGISQAALSRRIQDLERELGVNLFERLPRGVRLNSAGQSLSRDSRKIIDDFWQACQLCQRVSRGQVGILRVGLNDAAMKSPPVIEAFRAFRLSYPDVELRLVPDSSEGQYQALLDHQLDVGFMYMYETWKEGMDGLRIMNDEFALGMPSDHRLATRKSIKLAELREEPFVWPTRDSSRTTYDRMIAASERQGLSPRITAYINTLDQMLSIIAAGGGIGWVPRSYGRSPCKGVVARPVTDFRMTISLEMVWPEASKNPLVTGLADIVSSKVSKRVAV